MSLTGGNRNDVTQLMPLIEAVPPVRGRRGRPRRRPDTIYADRGYDHDKYRKQVRAVGITPVIARRGTEHGSGLGVCRLRVCGRRHRVCVPAVAGQPRQAADRPARSPRFRRHHRTRRNRTRRNRTRLNRARQECGLAARPHSKMPVGPRIHISASALLEMISEGAD